MSDGFQYPDQLDNITKAEIAARAMLMHHGYGANEADLAAAGETLGLAVAELLRDGYGKEAKMDWKALAMITGMTILVVASAKNMCYPAEATVDRETTMFLARGVEDQFYVVLNPLRAQTGEVQALQARHEVSPSQKLATVLWHHPTGRQKGPATWHPATSDSW